ncbi:MAG: M48 family metalloprotease [Desulfovibrionales bacterium]
MSHAAAIPTLLVELGYSRSFEREADQTAGFLMIEQGLGTKPFRDILKRLGGRKGREASVSILSTHPGMDERIQLLLDLEKSVTQ